MAAPLMSLDEAAAVFNVDVIMDHAPLNLHQHLAHPVRLAAVTVLSIAKNEDHDWFERALVLLKYIYSVYPTILPNLYHRIVTDFKAQIALYAFLCDATVEKRKFDKTLNKLFDPLEYGALSDTDYRYRVYQDLLEATKDLRQPKKALTYTRLQGSTLLTSLYRYLNAIEAMLPPPLTLPEVEEAPVDEVDHEACGSPHQRSPSNTETPLRNLAALFSSNNSDVDSPSLSQSPLPL